MIRLLISLILLSFSYNAHSICSEEDLKNNIVCILKNSRTQADLTIQGEILVHKAERVCQKRNASVLYTIGKPDPGNWNPWLGYVSFLSEDDDGYVKYKFECLDRNLCFKDFDKKNNLGYICIDKDYDFIDKDYDLKSSNDLYTKNLKEAKKIADLTCGKNSYGFKANFQDHFLHSKKFQVIPFTCILYPDEKEKIIELNTTKQSCEKLGYPKDSVKFKSCVMELFQ
jgi:hypothetical protein